MKKKFSKKQIVLLVVWIAITTLYIFSAFDSARSTSGTINDMFQSSIDASYGYNNEDNGVNASVAKLFSNGRAEQIRLNEKINAVFNVIYLVSTLWIYHECFVRSKLTKKE